MGSLRTALLAWIGLGLGSAPNLGADAWSDQVKELMAARKVPGLSLAVVDGGKIVRAEGYGVLELGREQAVTEKTLFQAGSVSKCIAALGALVLVQRGPLTLDGDVNDHLKSWRVPESELTRADKVTVRRLLSHSAGFTVHGFPGYGAGESVPSLLQVLAGERPANTPAIQVATRPGSQWRYSGGGYTVLQQLMIDVSGQRFPDFMREAVLEPLGMLASSYEQPLPVRRAPLAASGHTARKVPVPGRWHAYPELAAAGLWTTPTDLARAIIAVQAMAAGSAPAPLFSPELANDLLTAQIKNDGLGFFLAGRESTRRFEHGGRNEGFDTQLVAYVEGGRGAVVMINANDNSNLLRRVLELIADAYQWPDYPRVRPAPAIADQSPEITAQIQTLFTEAQAGRFDASLFTPELGQAIGRGISSAQEYLGALGGLQKVELTERTEDGGNRHFRYRLVFAQGAIVVQCVYAPSGLISGLSFQPE